MGPLGFPEMMIIFVVALIVFGPRKLPELGRSLGKGLSEFKRASNELRSTLDDEIRLEDHRAANTPVAPAPAAADMVTTDNGEANDALVELASSDAPSEPAPGETVPRSHTQA